MYIVCVISGFYLEIFLLGGGGNRREAWEPRA